MASIDLIPCQYKGDKSCRFNIVVVPGTAGTTLAARTCPHFHDWLDRIVAAREGQPQIWVYNHHIILQEIQSWDAFPASGDDLLSHLLSMLKEGRLSPDDKLILIGHKLGCYILKRALIEAFNKEHRPEEERLLSIVETIVMVGEPDLHSSNQAQWLQLISECVSGGKPLSGHLANDHHTVGSLEVIATRFEDACLYCTHFDIRSDARTSPRRKWKFGHKKHVGCVERATVCVRIFTTASAEQLLEAATGDVDICGLHPKSGHSRNLLLTAGWERADQNVRIAINTEEAYNHDATLSTPAADETIIATTDFDEAQGDRRQVDNALSSGLDQLDASDTEGQAREELAPTILDEFSALASDLSERPLDEASVTVPAISFCRQNQLLTAHTLRNDVVADITTIKINDQSKTSVFKTPRRRERSLPLSNTMPPKCQHFIGRAAELDEMSRYLLDSLFSEPGTSTGARVPKVICISGIGGTGKTQLALEYCSRSLACYDTVMWINASTRSSLGCSFHDCAMLQGLVEARVDQTHFESRDRLLNWCASTSKSWLLMLDGLDECFENDLSSFVPQRGTGSVIFTSQRELAVQGTIQHIKHIRASQISIADATALLRTHLHEGDNPVHRKAIALAAQRYHASPFALKHVIDWSRRERLSIRNIDDLLNSRDVVLRFGHDTINQVLAVSRPRLSDKCGSLFETMAFLDPDRIPHQMLLASQLNQYNQATETLVHASIEELWKSALCDVNTSGSFSRIHRSVAEWLQQNMTDDAWVGALVRASRSLQRQWPQRRKLRNVIDGVWPEFSHLHSHLQHTASACLHGGRRRLTDADDSLKDSLKQLLGLLLIHCWLNARHGNSDEDQELMHLTHALISRPIGSAVEMRRDTLMPRRCVYIGSESPSSTVSVVDTEGKHEPYLALSYSWEPNWRDDALNKANFAQFQRGLLVSELPTVIRDAIAVGRFIGFRYLWIDRYCMVQDDAVECSEEILRLTSYFQNAALTMSALAAPSLMHTFQRWGCKVVSCEPYSIWFPGSTEDESWTNKRAFLLEGRFLHDGNYLIATPSKVANISADNFFGSPGIDEIHVRTNGMNTIPDAHELEPVNQARQIEQARESLQIGRTYLCERSLLRASATLVFSRDLVGQLISRTAEALEIYTMATALLGTCYHLLDLDDVADDILTLLCEQHYSELCDVGCVKTYSHARLWSALGATSLRKGRNEAAQKCLRNAGKFTPASDIEEEQLFLICVTISLSDAFKAEGNTKEARRLLDGALDQLMDLPGSQTVDAHTCRALSRKSLLDEMEGSRIRYRASQAGAMAAFEQLQVDGFQAARNAPRAAALTQADFDALVEPWFV